MPIGLIALVLLAALLHASWNAIQKSAVNPAWAKVLYGPAAVLMLLPLTLLVSFPTRDVWPWIIGGSLLHLAYAVLLYWAFEHGAVFGRDMLHPWQIAGVLAVCGGIIALRRSGDRPLPRIALVAALLTATATAGYTVVDGLGARHSTGHYYSFIVWLFLLNALNSGTFFWIFQRPDLRVRPPLRELVKALAIPVVSMATFGMIIVATTLGALGAVSALRETSVVFAAILGWIFLKERFSPRRIAACVAVAIGAALVALG